MAPDRLPPDKAWIPANDKLITGTSVGNSHEGGWRIAEDADFKMGIQAHFCYVTPADVRRAAGMPPRSWLAKIYQFDMRNDTTNDRLHNLRIVSEKVITSSHRRIYPIIEGIAFSHKLGEYYVEIMRVAANGNLKDYLARLKNSLTREEWDKYINKYIETAIHDVGDALDYAHTGLDVAHRDVKATNILVLPDEAGFHCALSDFGVARPEPKPNADPSIFHARRPAHAEWFPPESYWNGLVSQPKPGDFFQLGLTLLELWHVKPEDAAKTVLQGKFDEAISLLPQPLRTLAICLLNGSPRERQSWVAMRSFAEKHREVDESLRNLLQPCLGDPEKDQRPYGIAYGIVMDPGSWLKDKPLHLDALKRWMNQAEQIRVPVDRIRAAVAEIEKPEYNNPSALTACKVAWWIDPSVPLRIAGTDIHSLDAFQTFLATGYQDRSNRPALLAAIGRLLSEGILQEWVIRTPQVPKLPCAWRERTNGRRDAFREDMQQCLDAIGARSGKYPKTKTNSADADALLWLALRHYWLPDEPFAPPGAEENDQWPESCAGKSGVRKFETLVVENISLLDRWRAAGWLSIWRDARQLALTGSLDRTVGIASEFSNPDLNPPVTLLLAQHLGATVRTTLEIPDCPSIDGGRIRHGQRLRHQIRLRNTAPGGMLAGFVCLQEERGKAKFALVETRSGDERARIDQQLANLVICGGSLVTQGADGRYYWPFVGNDQVLTLEMAPGECSVRERFGAQLHVYWNRDGVLPLPPDGPNYPPIPLQYAADINSGQILRRVLGGFAAGVAGAGFVGWLALHFAGLAYMAGIQNDQVPGAEPWWARWGDWHPLGPVVNGGGTEPTFYWLCLVGGLGVLALAAAFSVVIRPLWAAQGSDEML